MNQLTIMIPGDKLRALQDEISCRLDAADISVVIDAKRIPLVDAIDLGEFEVLAVNHDLSHERRATVEAQ